MIKCNLKNKQNGFWNIFSFVLITCYDLCYHRLIFTKLRYKYKNIVFDIVNTQ